MRFMEIPAFTKSIGITNLTSFYESRLAGGRTTEGNAGVRLLGYMGWPNDLAARENSVIEIQEWLGRGESGPLPPLRTAQQHWVRVADIVHLHHDMDSGSHQQKRGGASVGKAIHLLSKTARSKGTGEARLWTIWKSYKDVAHLVTAAGIVSADVKERHKRQPLNLTLQKLLPFRITLLMPELIIGLGMTIEHYGLQQHDHDNREAMFDLETLWRIPSQIGVSPLPMPTRELRPMDLTVLKDRRAGNRGKQRESETTPIL